MSDVLLWPLYRGGRFAHVLLPRLQRPVNKKRAEQNKNQRPQLVQEVERNEILEQEEEAENDQDDSPGDDRPVLLWRFVRNTALEAPARFGFRGPVSFKHCEDQKRERAE